MFTPFCSADLSTISIKEKRVLLAQLKEAIKKDAIIIKNNKVTLKIAKENEKKAKVMAQIQAAADKLARLQAKLV
jgi:hypothetical protein